MALFVKILLFTGLLGIAALGYVTYQNADTANKNQVALDDTKGQLKQANATIKTDDAKMADQANTITQKQSQVDALTQEKSTLNGQLADANNKVTDLQKQLDDKTKAAADVQAKLDALNQELGHDTVDSLRATATALQQDVAQKTTEMAVLSDALEKAKVSAAKIAKVLAAVNNHILDMPPLSGKVKFVNTTWNFVVLDVGTAQGVVPKGELNVFRGRLYLGKLKVSSVDTDSSVADIEPDVKGSVEVGDDVLSQ